MDQELLKMQQENQKTIDELAEVTKELQELKRRKNMILF